MEKKTVNDTATPARAQDRLTILEYIEAVLKDSLEFHGDRYFTDDLTIVGGVAILQGKPITVVDIQKGRDLLENIERNFGSSNPEGYRKVLRLMKQTERFNRPITIFVNTAGTYCGIGAEGRGEGEAIAQNLLEMSDLKVPVISVIVGEGGSGSALALAVTDGVWMLGHTIYVVLSPEGFIFILWKNGSCAKEAAELMKTTTTGLEELAVVDKVTPEVMSGQPLKQARINRMLRKVFISELTELAKLDTETLLKERY